MTDTVATLGASWVSGTSTSMTRLGDAYNKNAGTDFNEFYPWSEMKLCNVADDGTIIATIDDGPDKFKRNGNGQVMVKIRQFYYKHTYDDVTKEHQFWVADGPAAGYKLHPAFMRAGEQKDYVMMGAYKAGAEGTGETTKLTSVSGVKPAVEQDIGTFRTYAENRGTKWTQADILTRNAVALLYLVEYADTNSQSTIGSGVVDQFIAVASGGCDYLDGVSGTAIGEPGTVSVSYRGLEDLWGNVYEFVDGINIVNHRPYTADHGFKSDIITDPYTDAGFDLWGKNEGEQNGYISNFAYSVEGDWLLMPGEASGGSETTYIPDCYYQSTGQNVVMVGGSYFDSSDAGLFNYVLESTSSSKVILLGTRILLIP
jgi:hypothetical protein